MAKLTVVHKNTGCQEIDIGKNDKISWIVLHDDSGRAIIFSPNPSISKSEDRRTGE